MKELAYNEVSSSNVSATDLAKVLAVVKEFPYRTARELAQKVNPNVLSSDAIHKRLPELRKSRLVTNGLSRRCTVTDRRSQTWVAL